MQVPFSRSTGRQTFAVAYPSRSSVTVPLSGRYTRLSSDLQSLQQHLTCTGRAGRPICRAADSSYGDIEYVVPPRDGRLESTSLKDSLRNQVGHERARVEERVMILQVQSLGFMCPSQGWPLEAGSTKEVQVKHNHL